MQIKIQTVVSVKEPPSSSFDQLFSHLSWIDFNKSHLIIRSTRWLDWTSFAPAGSSPSSPLLEFNRDAVASNDEK